MNTQTNTQLINVVETVVLARMQAQESFTALDISNALKAEKYPFRHREVAEVVREIYESGAMTPFHYQRSLITVLIEGGAKTAEAYLYHHNSVDANDYIARDQEALPPVPTQQARDLSDCVAAGPLGLLQRPRSTAGVTRNSAPRSSQGRRDGALPIPRRLLEQLGWMVGSLLAVVVEPGRLTLKPDTSASDRFVRVWGGQRVRVCKTKLQLGALSADVATLQVDGDSLRIETNSLS